MIHETGEFSLPSGKAAGAKLFWQKWLPDTAPKAVVMLVHGYAEHSGRYTHVAQHLTDNGYAVYALDHWGHGQSDGEGGFIPSFSVLLDGIDAFFPIVRSEQPEPPMVLLGHSMGGLASALYLTKHQDQFKAAVLSGPAIVAADPPSGFVLMIAGLLSKIAPRLGMIPPLAEGVSRDPAVVEAYKNDPLVYQGKMGARMGHEMLTSMNTAQEQADRIKLPILLMHGDKDVLAAPEGSRLLHERVSSKDKTLIEYPGLHHEIFNEPEQQQVLGDMTDWLNERIA